MFVFKSALPSFCGLLAMTAMACGGDDSTGTGSQDITSAPSDGASSSTTGNNVPVTLPGCRRGSGASAVDPNATGADTTTGDATGSSSTDSTTGSTAGDAVPCTAPAAGALGNGTAAGTSDGTGGIGSGSSG